MIKIVFNFKYIYMLCYMLFKKIWLIIYIFLIILKKNLNASMFLHGL